MLHSAWDTSMPLTLTVCGDAFPVAGTQWCELCITFANWGQLARNLSHQFIIGVAYCDDKDATILANLWETNIKVCVTMRPSLLLTSDCSHSFPMGHDEGFPQPKFSQPKLVEPQDEGAQASYDPEDGIVFEDAFETGSVEVKGEDEMK